MIQNNITKDNIIVNLVKYNLSVNQVNLISMTNIIKKNRYPYIIMIMGPTASGKSKFVIKLRNYIPVDIISVDSTLIYKGMNIGTAKPPNKILDEIPHELINIRNPDELYSVGNFYYDATKAID
ncbi:MAG: hypothetical protein N4P93_01915, partial [Candidatus Lightella neohaematopini]|nr:hypothetical protein [Candidatus Lightella neohaematopini]